MQVGNWLIDWLYGSLTERELNVSGKLNLESKKRRIIIYIIGQIAILDVLDIDTLIEQVYHSAVSLRLACEMASKQFHPFNHSLNIEHTADLSRDCIL